MKRLFTLLIAAACLAALGACSDSAPKEFTTKISGTVVDRPESETIVLARSYEDHRAQGIDIPIVDGKFEYELTTNVREEWELIFRDEMRQGSMRPIRFFSEPGKVALTLHPMDRWEENILAGGKLNTEYVALSDSLRLWYELLEEGEQRLVERGFEPVYQTMSYNSETRQYEITEVNDNLGTPEGRALYEEYLALKERTVGREPGYLRDHPSIVSYARLYMEINSGLDWGMAAPYIAVYNEVGYAEKFPDSPYTREIANLLGAVGNIKVGGKYIDFTLPDLDGNTATVSELVADQIALIDLWMTWCGPCRSNAMAAIPVYEEFKDKGFTVVGVNGDGSLEGIKAAVQKDGYPWTTLVDLKGAAGIWSKYGISGAGGSSYLVDRDGTILAINPDAGELRKILLEKLGI